MNPRFTLPLLLPIAFALTACPAKSTATPPAQPAAPITSPAPGSGGASSSVSSRCANGSCEVTIGGKKYGPYAGNAVAVSSKSDAKGTTFTITLDGKVVETVFEPAKP